MFFAVAPHLIEEAQKLAVELANSDRQTMEIRSTGFYVTVNPGSRPVIHKFECENVCCYITMGK